MWQQRAAARGVTRLVCRTGRSCRCPSHRSPLSSAGGTVLGFGSLSTVKATPCRFLACPKTEFEYCEDGATERHLPRPGPGGFSRGSFIGWRRADRYHSVGDPSVEDLYELTSIVGTGGFGTVHAGRHRRTGEVVAIKTLDKDRVKDVDSLELEVQFLTAADHPHVVRYYETFEDEQHLHLIMEMCSGGALSQHIRSSHDCGLGVPEDDMKKIMLQMLRSMSYCHAHGIVHRDIKPQNFLFGCGKPRRCSAIPRACSGDQDAPLKLVDFGISGVVNCDAPGKRYLTKRAGTEGYMAPEVLVGQPYGTAADLFSLGCIMHHMLTEALPRFSEEKKKYVFPGRVRWATLSPEGKTLLERLTDEDESGRPSASEAMKDPWFEAVGVSAPADISKVFVECLASISNWARRTKLQRAIIYSMVAFAPLHNHHMEQLRTAFLAANTGGSGEITRDEFYAIACAHGSFLEDSPEELFQVVNSSQTGQICYSEWLAATAPQAWFDRHDYARRAFETLDVNRHGYVCAEDIAHILPGVLHAGEISSEIKRVSSSGDGRLAFHDFCALSDSCTHTSL